VASAASRRSNLLNKKKMGIRPSFYHSGHLRLILTMLLLKTLRRATPITI
jgi:hypothetical protein